MNHSSASLSSSPPTGVVSTTDQIDIERLANKLIASPAMTAQLAITRERFLADPAAATDDGRKTLERAVKEFAYLAALGAANSDAAHPRFTWAFPPPHQRREHFMSGSRWGIDNPDHVYRFVPIDGASRYEVHGQFAADRRPTQFSVLLYKSYMGEQGKGDTIDTPIAGLRDQDLHIEADGSFTISINSEPVNGRANHIRSDDSARILWVRNTFSDWSQEDPLRISIRRLSGPELPARSEDELAELGAMYLDSAAAVILAMKNGGLNGPLAGFSNHGQSNIVMKPILRGGDWGFMAPGNFRLQDDEALVVTVHPLGARYLGFQLSDPWTLSLDIPFFSSMNNRQAQASADGSITYVISAQNPGLHNWLDTGGLLSGLILVRWQVFPQGIASVDGAVRRTEVVKLAQLKSHLPADIRVESADERRRRSEQRVAEYASRYR